MVKLQMLFDIDLPTTVEEKLMGKFEGEEGIREEYRMKGRDLARKCPAVFSWLKANGYLEQDLIMTVGTKEENTGAEDAY